MYREWTEKRAAHHYLRNMVHGYLECMLWADLRDESGEPIGDDVALFELPLSVWRAAVRDCKDFLSQAMPLLDADGIDASQAGHDFWLTRNGHGAGFWDRGNPSGDALTDLCRPYGSCDPYLGDDGKVYLS